MRELELFRNYLERERDKHLVQAHRLAVGSSGVSDYVTIVIEAKKAEMLSQIIVDLKQLDTDAGAFVLRFLQ